MKKNILLAFLFSAFTAIPAFAQSSESQPPVGGDNPESKISKLSNPDAYRNGSNLNSNTGGDLAPNADGEQTTKQRNVATTPPANTPNPGAPMNTKREAHSQPKPTTPKKAPVSPATRLKSDQTNPR
jgi:hypothetical protein